MVDLDRSWMPRGACVGTDPDLFFPGQGSDANQVRMTKAICAGCPVRSECLEYSLAANEQFGIWGGYSDRERRRLRKQWVTERRAS